MKPPQSVVARGGNGGARLDGRSRDMAARFWAKVDKTGDCWVWTGSLTHCGYGRFKVRSYEQRRAHRVSYEMHFGPIPDGQLVCHRCDNRKCIRPDHLFLGSYTDNNRDMMAKGRHPGLFSTDTGARAARRRWHHAG